MPISPSFDNFLALFIFIRLIDSLCFASLFGRLCLAMARPDDFGFLNFLSEFLNVWGCTLCRGRYWPKIYNDMERSSFYCDLWGCKNIWKTAYSGNLLCTVDSLWLSKYSSKVHKKQLVWSLIFYFAFNKAYKTIWWLLAKHDFNRSNLHLRSLWNMR